jgi:hypothetical protein
LDVGGEKIVRLIALSLILIGKVLAQKKFARNIHPSLRSSHPTCNNTTMEDNHPQRARDSQVTSNNGAIAIKRARTELAGPTEAQIRRKKEAERDYGRGRKIHGRSNIRFENVQYPVDDSQKPRSSRMESWPGLALSIPLLSQSTRC